MYCSYVITQSCNHANTGPPALTVNITKNTESSSIVVQWDEVDDSLPTTYIVTWTSERDHIVHPVSIEEQLSYTITGLTLDTVYTITVIANNKCGDGPEYSTSVSLSTDTTSSNTSAITSTMAITSAATSSASTAITRSSTITSIAVKNPSTTTTNPITTSIITDLKTSSTNPSTVITSTNSATDNMSPVSTTNPIDINTADENSKILSISICNYHILSLVDKTWVEANYT